MPQIRERADASPVRDTSAGLSGCALNDSILQVNVSWFLGEEEELFPIFTMQLGRNRLASMRWFAREVMPGWLSLL